MLQAFIDKLILHTVREGHRVVHLKAGSPFAFACVAREIENLKAAGVPCQIRHL
jgi:siroheme synthase